MSTIFATSSKDSGSGGYIVVAPRACDVLSSALRTAFDRPGERADEFADLLRRVDRADRGPGRPS